MGVGIAVACSRVCQVPLRNRPGVGRLAPALFVDPKQKLAVVFGTAAPGPLRKYDREQVQGPVYGPMTR